MEHRLLIFVFLLVSVTGWGANHYVLASASGTASGNDWINAFTDLPASLTRGDTYFMGTGTYARHVFNDTESGTSLITIQRATIASHGTATGWSNAFDGTVTWSTGNTVDVWEIANSYYTFEGVTGSGTSGYGYKMSSDTNFTFAFIRIMGGIGNVTINHLEADGVSCCNILNTASGTSAIYAVSTSGAHSASVNLNSDYFHNMKADPVFLIWNDNSTFDHLVLGVNRSTASQHGQGLDVYGLTNFTLRYSTFIDITGTAQVVNIGSGDSSTMAVYGNVFYFTGTDPQWSQCVSPCVQDGGVNGPARNSSYLFESIPGAKITGLKFYNNTAFGWDANHCLNAGFYPNAADTGYDVQDNLWFNAQCGVGFREGGVGTHDYNTILNGSISAGSAQTHEFVTASGSSNPFVSSASGNFNLSSETIVSNLNNGLNLNSLLAANTTDASGITRGSDGTWDRGALEYSASGTPPTNVAPAIGMFGLP